MAKRLAGFGGLVEEEQLQHGHVCYRSTVRGSMATSMVSVTTSVVSVTTSMVSVTTAQHVAAWSHLLPQHSAWQHCRTP